MALGVDLNFAVSATLTKSGDLSSVARVPLDFVFEQLLAEGQVDKIWWDDGLLTEAETDILDLSGGLIDVFGVPIDFASVKLLAVVAGATNVGDLHVGGDATDFPGLPADSPLVLPPGGCVFLSSPATGWVVTSGVTDSIHIENTSATDAASYSIVIAGLSV